MASREHLKKTTAMYETRELPWETMQRGGYKGIAAPVTVIKQVNPIADTPNWQTGGRNPPSFMPDAKYLYAGLAIAVLLVAMKRRKK